MTLGTDVVVALVVAALTSTAAAAVVTYRFAGGRERTDADVSAVFASATASMVSTLREQLNETSQQVEALTRCVRDLQQEVRSLEMGVAVLSQQLYDLGQEPQWRRHHHGDDLGP